MSEFSADGLIFARRLPFSAALRHLSLLLVKPSYNAPTAIPKREVLRGADYAYDGSRNVLGSMSEEKD